jgi:DNA-directed RNA polymerase subunit RPC12/RpoP
MKKKHFIRKKEDFVCINCSEKVSGTGYTNHCPKCLFGMHVDKDVPGDRKSACRGVMKPIEVDMKGQEYVIIHKCNKCGKITRNKASKDDDFEEIIRLSAR